MRGQTRREAGPVALLTEILRGTASLSGAACVGSAELFDPRDPHEDAIGGYRRHFAAAQVCRRCPVIDACREWADGDRKQAQSVTAGRVPKPPGRPRRSEKGGSAA
ncbi:WhiB family transcriptional regulator [Gordonia metallireducens]|uniref:WhiB family transcriptional regulator n=1 Tax=Gordonia metallireducens TaxID=2897779 RepID=UPI001E2E2953|nr:WhiB family transcriptional regulator [Gordonia metallireducens]